MTRDSNHTDRIERDLNQIADRATPSSTAWEAIRQRIDEQDNRATSGTESTMEVIMLSPDRNEPRNRSRTWMAVAASVAALALVGGLIVAANRDTDDDVPAGQPAVTVTIPDTAGVDGETAPAPDAEQTVEQNPAPEASVAVDPDTVDPEAAPDPVVEQATETLPVVELLRQGTWASICPTGQFDENADGSLTGQQTCLNEGDPLPVPVQGRNALTVFPSSPDTPFLFVSTGDTGFLSAGYTSPDESVRYSGLEPGADDFAGETISFLGRRPAGGDEIPGISDWTTEPGDAPLPTTEEGGISAEVTIACSAVFIEGDDTSQVLEQTCTYAGDDARFVPEPEVITVRLFAADPDATNLAAGTPAFITGTIRSTVYPTV